MHVIIQLDYTGLPDVKISHATAALQDSTLESGHFVNQSIFNGTGSSACYKVTSTCTGEK